MNLSIKDKKIYSLYLAFAICVITSCIPNMGIQSFGAIFSIVTIIAFYTLRKKWGADNIVKDEASFMIKTFWIWSAIYVVGMMIAGIMISSLGDMSSIHQWTEQIMEGGAPPDEAAVKLMMQQYMDANYGLIVKMSILCVAPSVIYAGWRLWVGISRRRHAI